MTASLSSLTDWALTSGVRLVGILFFALLLNRLLKTLSNRLIHFASSDSRSALMREQQTRTLTELLYSAGTALIIAVAAVTALTEFGFNIGPIATVAGLASLAFGFGAQHLVRDIINGFFIIFEDQFVIGDTVRIGGFTGRVEHMTLRRTVLRDTQGAVVTIPNGEIRQLANLNRDWSQLFVDVALSNEEDVSRALAVLEEVAAQMRSDDTWRATMVDGPRVLGVESLSLQGVTLRMQVRTAPTRQHEVARELRRRIRARLAQEKIGLTSVEGSSPAGGEKT